MDSIVSDFYQYVSGMMSEGSCEERRTFAKRKSPVERKEDQRSESTETGRKEKKDESLIDVLNKNTAYNIE